MSTSRSAALVYVLRDFRGNSVSDVAVAKTRLPHDKRLGPSLKFVGWQALFAAAPPGDKVKHNMLLKRIHAGQHPFSGMQGLFF